MEKQGRGFNEPQLQSAGHQCLQGLSFLHGRNVIHRDLNASNILLGEGGIVKLADFGVSVYGGSQRRSTFIGSPNWMAPEVVACEKDRAAFYNCICDIWSFGITMIELAERRPPHHDATR